MLFVLFAVACSENENVVNYPKEGVEVHCEDFELGEVEDFTSTRSSLLWDVENGKTIIRFNWQDGDKIKVFSDDELNVNSNLYTLRVVEQGGSSAYFNGGGFNLNEKSVYYAFSPASAINDVDEYFRKEAIVLSYENQTQVENDNCDHLGKYDYQVACARVSEDGYAQMKFKHLGTVARIRFSGVPGQKFKKFEIVSSDNYDFQYERKLDLTDDGENESNYGPTLGLVRAPEIEGEHSFVLNLTDETHDGITVPAVSDENPTPRLVLYMMLPASDELNGKLLYGIITECDKDGKGYIPDDGNDSNNNKYFIAMPGKKYVAGQYIAYGDKAASSEKLNISLTIDKDWQIGTVQNLTRASNTGDPGVDDNLLKPDHIYVYTCIDGKYQGKKEIVVDSDNDWSDRWSYKENIIIDLEGAIPNNNVHIYVIASKGEITRNTTEVLSKTNNTEESVVANMTMDLSSSFDDDVLKNIYTYDYVLDYTQSNVNPIINATLYHTCAKLDVQWNSETALSGSVSVNNLPTTGLKLFKPTENTGSDSWSPSETITTGSMYNGRAVFYVPQLSTPTYNISVGTPSDPATKDNVTFTAPTTKNKWTSWFKANIKK